MKGVQRFLINKNNHLRTAAVLSAPVRSITDAIQNKPISRFGSLRAAVSGTFTGEEQAEIQIEILDEIATVPLETEPSFVGIGNGVMSAVGTTALSPRTITAELTDLGEVEEHAEASLQGVRIVVAEPGANGNKYSLVVERTGLTFTPQAITLLTSLQEGTKSVVGPQYDWATVIVDGDGQVPSNAKRIAFGENENNIYVQYKQFVDGAWTYFFEPALKEYVDVMTPISFVTGEYTVYLYEDVAGVPTLQEIYSNITTLYDLLNAIKTTSAILRVEGNVLYDRAPGGQALQELSLRTDAYYIQNTGFKEVVIQPNTPTELIQATCFAATSSDDERAGLGSERWEVRGSVSGLIKADVGTDELIEAAYWSGKIKPKLPAGATLPHGKFAIGSITYVAREGEETTPPICPAALTLGLNAQKDTITLTWKARPVVVDETCDCSELAAPDLSASACLGLGTDELEQGNGGLNVPYQADTIARLVSFYDWMGDTVKANSAYVDSGVAISVTEDRFITSPFKIQFDVAENSTNIREQLVISLKVLAEKYEKTLALIDAVTDTDLRDAGGTAWDAAVTELQDDIAVLTESDELMNLADSRYTTWLKKALISAGISPLGKFDAAIGDSGDDCWRDWGDDFYFEVEGDSGLYAPAFVNRPYISAKKRSNGFYYSTKEFGFQINVGSECVAGLKEGDKITLIISGVAERAGYAVGDKIFLGILGDSPFAFTGGKDGDNVQTWYVTDSEEGPLATYALDTASPAAYSDSGVTFLITPGSLAFAKGDAFTFDVEGGHFRWRSIVGGVAGAWSAATAIDVTPIALEDGLSVTFTLGTAKAIYTGDVFKFTALQPYAVSNLIRPDFQQWGWGAADPATIIFDLGSVKAVEALALAFHDLPEEATVTVSGSGDNITYDWDEVIAWQSNAMGKLVDQQARYVRVVIENAPESAVGWIYAGSAIYFTYSAEVSLKRQYRMDRASSDLASFYRGRGVGGDVTWREGSIVDDDYEKMVELLDWLKENDDETLLFFLQETRDELVLAKVDNDTVDFNDVYNFQPNVNVDRRLSCTIPLRAVIF